MSVRQIIVLGIALIAAVGALFTVRTIAGAGQEKAASTVAEVGPRVLVAARDIGAGIALQPADLEWRVWAQTSLSPQFIEEREDARAVETLTGAVVRQAVVAGEPIMLERVVKPGDQGFMAALVSPGYRAVSLPITNETAASGFILPNDRVDVILTRRLNILSIGGGSQEEVRSGVVLQDVRVLAIDQEYLRDKDTDEPSAIEGSVALLELSPRDSELLAMADEMGDLSLALRSVASDKSQAVGSNRVADNTLQQANAARDEIKMHSFGTAKSVSVSPAGAAKR